MASVHGGAEACRVRGPRGRAGVKERSHKGKEDTVARREGDRRRPSSRAKRGGVFQNAGQLTRGLPQVFSLNLESDPLGEMSVLGGGAEGVAGIQGKPQAREEGRLLQPGRRT